MQIACDPFAFGYGGELFDLFMSHAELGIRALLPRDEGIANSHDTHQKNC